MAILNVLSKKKKEHKVTYKRGGRCLQIDYNLWRKNSRDQKLKSHDGRVCSQAALNGSSPLEIKSIKENRFEKVFKFRWCKLKRILL